MRTFILSLIVLLASFSMTLAASLHDFTITGIDGKPMALSQYKGSAVLLVNTASECGFTGQYDGLEKLWETYKGKGLVIVGVPSNDFGGQEPGKAEDIAAFCKLNYGVAFPLADKAVVKGKDAIPVYVWAGKQAGLLGRPKWNFHKYLFSRDGQFIDWFSSPTDPMSKKLTAAVEKALAQ